MADLATLINKWINKVEPGAPLAGQGQMLVEVGQKYGVDPRALAAIARKESQFGKTSGRFKNNAWGWGVHLGPSVNTSPTWRAGAEKVAKGLSGSLYKGSGLKTLSQILMKYAPPSENNTRLYQQQVNQWMREMGGNPSQSIFSNAFSVGGNAGRNNTGNGTAAPGIPAQTMSVQEDPRDISSEQLVTSILNRAPGQSVGSSILSTVLSRAVNPVTQEVPVPGTGTPDERTGESSDTGPTSSLQRALRMGGGPGDHGARPLGNWQSDRAYDLMGKAGQQIFSPVVGTVTKISGKPGGSPQFAGYGITVKTKNGSLFFKHLGTSNVRVGDRIGVGDLIGTLEKSTQGGPHLHLGGDSAGILDAVKGFYLNPRRGNTGGGGSAPKPGGGWAGTQAPVEAFAALAKQNGLSVMSAKRDRQNTSSGGRSDHWIGSKDSYAMDLSNGSSPTPQMDRTASQIVRQLGGPKNWGVRGGVFNTTVGGIRYQVIYRSNVGGNHFNHVHVGARRA